MSKILPYRFVEQAYRESLEMLRPAANPRTQTVSRKRVKMLGANVRYTELGAQQLQAAKALFAWADHVDHKPGARLTMPELERRAEQALQMAKAYDRGHNGFSSREIAEATRKSPVLHGTHLRVAELRRARIAGISGGVT